MAKFAYDTLKVKKVAILVDVRSDYSVGLADVLHAELQEAGRRDRRRPELQRGRHRLQRAAHGDQGRNPDAIFVPGYYTEVGTIAHQARELGIDGAAARRRRLGLAQALRRSAARRSTAPTSRTTTRPTTRTRASRSSSPTTRPSTTRCRTPSPRSATTPRNPLRRDDSAPGSTDRRKGARRDRRDQGLPGRDRQITIDARAQRGKPAVVLKVENGKYLLTETIKPEAMKPVEARGVKERDGASPPHDHVPPAAHQRPVAGSRSTR